MRKTAFLCLFLAFCLLPVFCDRVRIQTKAGQTFDAVCPAKHYVSSLKLDRITNSATNETDFQFTVECQSFYKNVAEDTVCLIFVLFYLWKTNSQCFRVV